MRRAVTPRWSSTPQFPQPILEQPEELQGMLEPCSSRGCGGSRGLGRAGSGGRSGDAAAADAAPVPGRRVAAWQEQDCDAKHKR